MLGLNNAIYATIEFYSFWRKNCRCRANLKRELESRSGIIKIIQSRQDTGNTYDTRVVLLCKMQNDSNYIRAIITRLYWIGRYVRETVEVNGGEINEINLFPVHRWKTRWRDGMVCVLSSLRIHKKDISSFHFLSFLLRVRFPANDTWVIAIASELFSRHTTRIDDACTCRRCVFAKWNEYAQERE